MESLVLLLTINQRDVKNEKWVALNWFLSRQIPRPIYIHQSAYSFWQEKKRLILLTEQFVEVWLQHPKTSALAFLRTDRSFQRGKQRRARTRTSAVEVQHPVDQCKRPRIRQFKPLSQLQTRICIKTGAFVMRTMTFRRSGRWSQQARGANALNCLSCFGWAWKWKWNASARARELAPFLLRSYLQARPSEWSMKNLAEEMGPKLTQKLKPDFWSTERT